MTNYEESCPMDDFPDVKESLEVFYKSRRVYLQDKSLQNQVIARNDMHNVFFLAKGYMSMGYITMERFQFIKEHLEEGWE